MQLVIFKRIILLGWVVWLACYQRTDTKADTATAQAFPDVAVQAILVMTSWSV